MEMNCCTELICKLAHIWAYWSWYASWFTYGLIGAFAVGPFWRPSGSFLVHVWRLSARQAANRPAWQKQARAHSIASKIVLSMMTLPFFLHLHIGWNNQNLLINKYSNKIPWSHNSILLSYLIGKLNHIDFLAISCNNSTSNRSLHMWALTSRFLNVVHMLHYLNDFSPIQVSFFHTFMLHINHSAPIVCSSLCSSTLIISANKSLQMRCIIFSNVCKHFDLLFSLCVGDYLVVFILFTNLFTGWNCFSSN
jgi:hypothetical protein